MPRVTIDFFRIYVTDPNYNGTVDELFTRMNALVGRARNVVVASGWHHFYRMGLTDRRIGGDVVRVRADIVPFAMDQDGNVQDLQLGPDQGIAAETFYYYRRTNRVMLMLRSPGGLSGPGFEHLVKVLTDVDVQLRPVPLLEKIEKLRRLREIRKIEFKFAMPDLDHHFRAGRGITEIFDAMSEFDATVAEVKLAVTRRSAALNRARAVAVAEQLQRVAMTSGEVKKVKIRGHDPVEQRTIALDLLEGRMKAQAEVALGPNRWLDSESCLGALENAYIVNSEDLDAIYADEV